VGIIVTFGAIVGGGITGTSTVGDDSSPPPWFPVDVQQLHWISVRSTANVRSAPPLDALKLHNEFKSPDKLLSLRVRRTKLFASSIGGGTKSPDS
jgi:hypothetical protein